MPAPKRVTPRLVGTAAFAVVLATGLGAIWFDHRQDQAAILAEERRIGLEATTTTPDHRDGDGKAPDGLGADDELGHGNVPLPTLPPPADDGSQPGQPPVTATTTPVLEPDETDAPRPVDPGPDPIAPPPKSDLFMAIKQAENQSMWLYGSILTMDELVAHYMGALSSGEWIVTDSRPLKTSPDPSAPIEFYEIYAAAPGRAAMVRIHVNTYGTPQAQLEITEL